MLPKPSYVRPYLSILANFVSMAFSTISSSKESAMLPEEDEAPTKSMGVGGGPPLPLPVPGASETGIG